MLVATAKAEHTTAQAHLEGARKLDTHPRAALVTTRNATSVKLAKRRAQLAYAVRVVARHATSDVRIVGNTVTGGTAEQRLAAAMDRSVYESATGKRDSFYSQSGAWDVDHAITGPARGSRDDCSAWFTSIYKACGLPDPNGLNYTGGFTGTLGTHGTVVSRANARIGSAVLVGVAPFHHVEMLRDPKTGKTAGHGTAMVNYDNVAHFSPVTFCNYPLS